MADAGLAVGLIVGGVGAAAGVFGWLARYTVATKDKDAEKEHESVEKDVDSIKAELKEVRGHCSAHEASKTLAHSELMVKIHDNAMEVEKLKGAMRLVEQQNAHLDKAIDEIQEQMVPRKEWDSRMTHVEQLLNTILGHIRSTPSRADR